MHKKSTKVMLIVLDGFGLSLEKKGNAIAQAKTPELDAISSNYPGAVLQASGPEVGLKWGEVGNSEVGHGNIGAGMVVYQHLTQIDIAIKDKTFQESPVWKNLTAHCQKEGSPIHIMGLVSNGGVHSHIDHLITILDLLKRDNPRTPVFIHFFSDGQDVAAKSADKFYDLLKNHLSENVRIASICGRYYAMDKSENWDRTKKAYDCLTNGIGNKAKDFHEALKASYDKGLSDERIEPTVIVDDKDQPVATIKEKDAVIFFDFRADRARQLTQSLIFKDFKAFDRTQLKNLFFVTMTEYGKNYPAESIMATDKIQHPLAAVLSENGLSQFHIAETEKYAHVTYFFNGGTEDAFKGEDRVIIDSPKVKSYDEKPEMSAHKIETEVLANFNKYDFIVVNFANGDMVGHTGNFKAGISAIEVLDECVGKLVKAMLNEGGTIIITADHGNIEQMINSETGEIDKEHTTNPVPLWLISPDNSLAQEAPVKDQLIPEGILADVAPTILEIFGIDKPKDMTGTSLLSLQSSCRLPK